MPVIVVLGGVAAGTSAASQAKRRKPDTQVILLERGPFVSYGACGIPYNLQDAALPIEDLVAISAERFRTERQIDVRLRHEALAFDAQARKVRVRDHAQGSREYELGWDHLIIATGAQASRLHIAGADLPGVHVVRELTDGDRLKRALAEQKPTSAILIGAGYIGMELAETLRSRGLRVTVLEKGPQVVPGFAPAIAMQVHAELVRQEVQVETGIELTSIERPHRGEKLQVRTARGTFEADLVVIAVGIKPNVALSKQAGVRLGQSGAIAVNEKLETNLANVWAAGDCAEATHLVSGEQVWVPLGTTANKQGKIAGANAVGADERFPGLVGTAAFKVFELEVARTGLGPSELEKLKLSWLSASSTQNSRANSFPGGQEIHTVLYVERGSGRLLGAQMVGREGVAKRIDVLATALHARMTVAQVEDLDLAYAPPFSPVYDPILIAATVAQKALREA